MERGRTAGPSPSGEHPGPSGERGPFGERNSIEEQGPAHRPAPAENRGPAEDSPSRTAEDAPAPSRTGAGGTPPGPPAGTDSGRSAGNPIARVLVVLLTATVVVLGGAGAVDAIRQGAQAGDSDKTAWARNRQSQMETIRAQLDAEVPPGSRIYLGNNRNDLWYQRVLEFAAMDGIIVVSRHEQADFTLSVEAVPRSVSPAGVRLVATRDR